MTAIESPEAHVGVNRGPCKAVHSHVTCRWLCAELYLRTDPLRNGFWSPCAACIQVLRKLLCASGFGPVFQDSANPYHNSFYSGVLEIDVTVEKLMVLCPFYFILWSVFIVVFLLHSVIRPSTAGSVDFHPPLCPSPCLNDVR